MSTDLAPLAHRVRARALDWLHAHRQLGAFEAADVEKNLGAYKAVGETALAAGLVLRCGTAGSRERVLAAELLEFCWAQMGQGALLYERLSHHPVKTDPVECYSLFAAAGYRHPGLEQLITHLVTAGAVRAVEVLPNRRLAVANALRATGHDQGVGAPDWETLTRATWLGHLPQPWHIDWEAGYDLTHTVFHLTDWGRRPQALPADLAAYLGRWLPVWIDTWTEVGQWDLVGELLIVAGCLPAPYTEIDDWRRLAQLQHPDGLVPRDGDPVDDAPAARFEDHQHTTIVAVIAATVALTRDLDTPAAANPGAP
jgi:hypothetical protein